MQNEIKKLVYRSKNRGCKEMDIVLGNFANQGISTLNAKELMLYAQLLDEPDNDIWAWISGMEIAPDEYLGLIAKVKNHAE